MDEKKKQIQAIILDVDGTLTDGTINIGENGELFKSFYCRDGLAIMEAERQGILTVILTSRTSEIVTQRAKELNIQTVLQGAGENKAAILQSFMKEKNLTREEVAYIGDDINDLESMELCELIGCPADAVPAVKKKAIFVSQFNGGRGAVREFIDWLLE